MALRHAVVALAIALSAITSPVSAQQKPTVILFVGNSFLHGHFEPVLHYNTKGVIDENAAAPAGSPLSAGAAAPYGGIPAIFKVFTEELGLNYEVHNELVSGKTLQFHYDNALPVIAQPKWDKVVMHDLSTGPVPESHGGNPARFEKYATMLEQAIHAANSRAEVFLYETFPRADITYAPTGKTSYKGDSIEVMAMDLHDAYAREFASNGKFAGTAHVGDAWRRAFRENVAIRNPAVAEHGKLNLWGADSYHPSIYGAYLNALVILQAVTGNDPRALGANERAARELGIDAQTAVRLQQLAYEPPPAPDPAPAQDNPLARYGIVDELVLADSAESMIAGAPPPIRFGPRGPPGSAAFILVFVVDTLGKVEMPSVSFGNDVSAPFIKATCTALRELAFQPVRRDGALRRALNVQAISVQRSDMPAVGRVTSEPLRRAIREGGVVESLPIFAKQPHCE